MLLSVSRRTDIPAWYADWFSAALQRGLCSFPPLARRTACTRSP